MYAAQKLHHFRVNSLRSGMDCLICDQNTFILYRNLALESYIISVSAKDLKYKMLLLYHRCWKYFLCKTTKREEKVGKTSGLWPHLCSVTFLYGRLQNHINKAQQFSSLGFSFPSLHCPKANKPFHLQVFLHSKM